MKIRSFLLSMLVVAGFSACSDDVIDNGGNEVGTTDATPAYLTISFSANSSGSSRSTADDANNIGDQDGSAEDSEHENDGTAAENAIKTVLVVVKPIEGNSAYAKLYTTLADATDGQNYGFGLVNNSTLTYTSGTPITLSVGTYKVLVIANPISQIYGTLNVQEGVSDVKTVEKLYDDIISGDYDSTTSTATGWVGDLTGGNSFTNGFMMANKAESEDIVLTEANTSDNPKVTDPIEIERVVSKVTFRHTINGTDKDRYPIQVAYGGTAKKIEETIDGATVTLNCAILREDGREIFITVDADKKIEKVYTLENGTYTEWTDFDADTNLFDYVIDESTTEKATWYVQIEKYALVNLSKKVYYVRHTVTEGGFESAFGTLNGINNFLLTSYWKEKNAVAFDADNNFVGTPEVSNWFYNTLEHVSDASDPNNADVTADDVFKSFDENYESSDDDEGVKGSGDQHKDPLANIGETLAYCLENSTNKENQTHGLSTGIAFQAKIYKEDGSSITTLYRYAGNIFTSIEDIQKAYGETATDAIKGLTETSTKEELAAAGVTKYNDNECYYYTTEIKHFDNNDPRVLGNMEFAIMRNNIYSLSITGISKIGDPFVDPTPGIENESKEAALSVQAKIVPWIVRYHDIEF